MQTMNLTLHVQPYYKLAVPSWTRTQLLREWVHLYLFQVLAANGLCLGPFGNIQYGSSFQPLPPPSSDDEHRRPLNFELNS